VTGIGDVCSYRKGGCGRAVRLSLTSSARHMLERNGKKERYERGNLRVSTHSTPEAHSERSGWAHPAMSFEATCQDSE